MIAQDLSVVPLWANIDGRLVEVQATKQELILGKAMEHYLRKCTKMFSKRGQPVRVETKLLGTMSYKEHNVGRGRRRVTQHHVTFVNENYAFHYEEMRHALQIAIFGIVGQSVSLILSFEMKTAVFQLPSGGAMSDIER